MKTSVNRWGTSYGIRITKSITELFPVTDKQKLDVRVEGDKLIFTKAREPKPEISLKEYLDECIKNGTWDGKPCEPEVIDWGPDVGGEITEW